MLTSFARAWIMHNTAALLVAYALYTPIAHGVTGGHASRELSVSQLAAHSIALATVGVVVFTAQRLAMVKFVSVSWTRVLVATIAFIVAFWVGYFQRWVEGPDTDILLAYFVLGSGVWLGKVPINGHRLAGALALLSFPIASFVGELFLLVAFTFLQVTPAIQTSEIQHSVFWITVGGVTGLLGGWLSGLALSRMLPKLTNHPPEQTLAADALSRQD